MGNTMSATLDKMREAMPNTPSYALDKMREAMPHVNSLQSASQVS
jgi:IS4 transposase